jgi:N-acyl-D-amino-acid deacylase
VSIRVFDAFDILITGGRVIDGTGNPWFLGDVGIRGDRIAAVGALGGGASARQRIDAAGKVVAPGFIDAHVHGDLALFLDPLHEPAIRQGVTTYIIGQDGVALAPGSVKTLEYMCRYTAGFSAGAEWLALRGEAPFGWSSVAEYLARFDGRSAVNVATLVPNGNVRLEVMGLETRQPTSSELLAMARLVREGMEQGAIGLSSGLDYIPSRYAEEDELAELCKAVAHFGGVYVTHMRRYDPDGVHGSMDEVARIGQKAGVAVHISHFNSRVDIVLPKLDSIRAGDVDMTYDLYCYLAGSSILGMYTLPPWAQEGGLDATLARLADQSYWPRLREWFSSPPFPLDKVRLSYVAAPAWKHYEGMTLGAAVARAGGGDGPERIGEFIRDVLIASGMAVGCVVPHRRRGEEDVRALMRHPAMMAGSDGIYTGSHPHPRGCGCFARYLGHYVREGVWSLETAVQRLSSHCAGRFGLRDRGLLRPGMAADVVVFDADTIADRSTFDDGKLLASGVEHVLVNGELVLHAGERTTALPGRGLKRTP